MIGSFCTQHSICINIGFWQSSFVGNVTFSILILSNEKIQISILFASAGVSFETAFFLCVSLTLKRTEAVVRMCFVKGVLRNFAKFTGKHLCQSLFFNKVAGWGKLGSCYSKSTRYKRFLNWHKIVKKVVTVKTPFFVVGPFSTPHSFFCLKIGFWQGKFVSKYCVFNLSISN